MSADRPSCDFRYGRPDSQYDWMLAGTASCATTFTTSSAVALVSGESTDPLTGAIRTMTFGAPIPSLSSSSRSAWNDGEFSSLKPPTVRCSSKSIAAQMPAAATNTIAHRPATALRDSFVTTVCPLSVSFRQ